MIKEKDTYDCHWFGVVGWDHCEDPISYGTECPEELDVVVVGGPGRIHLNILFTVRHCCCIFSVSNKIIGHDV